MLKYLSKKAFRNWYKQILSSDTFIASFSLSYIINNQLSLRAYFGGYYGRYSSKDDDEMWVDLDLQTIDENPDLIYLRIHFQRDEDFEYSHGYKRSNWDFDSRKENRDKLRETITNSFIEPIEIETFDKIQIQAEKNLYKLREKKTRNYSIDVDPAAVVCHINIAEIYFIANEKLTGLIANDPKNPTLKFWRAYNFFAYNTITKKSFLDNYGEKDALDDLNSVIEMNDKSHLVILLTALELRAKKAIENKDLLLAVRLVRQAVLIIYSNGELTKVYNKKISLPYTFNYKIKELICDIRSKNAAKNPGKLGVEYHAIMALNHSQYFPNWRSQIVALFKHIDVDNPKEFKVFVNFIKNDDMAFEYQKISILKEFYAYAFKTAKSEKDKVKQKNIYDNLLSVASDYLIESNELTESDLIKAAECQDIALSIFNKIPLEHETAIEAQISLADHYYYTNLDEHADKAKAFVTANPYQQKALAALKKQGADTPQGDFQLQQRFTNYSRIIEDRKNAAEEYEKTIPKKPKILIRLLSVVKSWFTITFESKNPLTEDKKPDVVRPKSEADESKIISSINSEKPKIIATQSTPKQNRWRFSFNFSFNFFRTHSQKNENKNNVLQEDTQAVTVTPKP